MRPHRVDNARVGRYFTAEPAASDVGAARQRNPSTAPQPPAAVAAAPQGTAAGTPPAAEAACLAAVSHLRPRGAPDAAAGLAAALAEVDRALNAGSSSGTTKDAASPEPLLLLRLRLLQAAQSPAAQPTSATKLLTPADVAADAASRCPGSYALWCAAADAQPHWRNAVFTLHCGIVAASGAGGSLGANCALDLALRLLATWTAAGQVRCPVVPASRAPRRRHCPGLVRY